MKKQLLQYRKLFLTLLLTFIFINWYYHIDTYRGTSDFISSFILSEIVTEDLNHQSIYGLLGKGLALLIIISINIVLSLLIVFFYFKGNKDVLKLAFFILAFYGIILFLMQVLAYVIDSNELFIQMRKALTYLASPLTEAALIPLLRLYTVKSASAS